MWGRNCATPVLSWCDYPGKQHVRANSAVRVYSQMASAVGSLQLSIASSQDGRGFRCTIVPARRFCWRESEGTHINSDKERKVRYPLAPSGVCLTGRSFKGSFFGSGRSSGKKEQRRKKVAGTMLFQYKVRLEVASICDKGYCDIYYSNVFIMWIAICPWPNSN